MNRRMFIGAVGAGIAPMILPARARGANERIGLAIIGVGKMGMAHLKSFADMADIEIRGVADVEASRREQARQIVEEKYAAVKRKASVITTVDYQALLARKDIDAVVIATPDHWHTTQLIHAAHARKDIYCEKPLTLTLEESDLAVRAVRKHKVILQTGSQQRSENEGRFRIVSEYIRNGRIGKVRAISVHFGPTGKAFCDLPEENLDGGLDWERWLGQAPKRPYHHLLCQRGAPEKYPFLPGWRDYREYSGGQVTDWGCHHLDIIQWALGMDGNGPAEALPPKGDPLEGGGQLVYRSTPVGADIVVTHRTYGNGIRFQGEKGELWVNRKELTSLPDGVLKEPLTDRDTRLEDASGNHRRNWLECIRSRKDPICKVEVGAGTAAVAHLLNLAYWNGRKVEWDPVKWTLATGAPPEWRNRPQRKGYELPKV